MFRNFINILLIKYNDIKLSITIIEIVFIFSLSSLLIDGNKTINEITLHIIDNNINSQYFVVSKIIKDTI